MKVIPDLSDGDWNMLREILFQLSSSNSVPYSDGNVRESTDYISFIFKRAATQPTTPAGNGLPTGWSDAPPADDGNPLWFSKAYLREDGTLIGTWSAPIRLDGDGGGTDGLNAVMGSIVSDNGLVFVQAQNDGAWTPTATTTTLTVTFYQGGSAINTRTVVITRTSATLSAPTPDTVDGITYAVTGNGTSTITINFEHVTSGIKVAESAYAVRGGLNGANGFTPITSANCVGHWKMNDTSGTSVADSIFNGHNGVSANEITSVDGKIGKAISLNGTSDYITIGDIDKDVHSLAFWFYTAAAIDYNTSSSVPVHIGSDAADRINFGACTGSFTGEIITILDGNGGRTSWVSTTESMAIGWHHLCLVWDGAKYLIYVDNVQKQNSVAGTPVMLTANNLVIGRWSGAALYFAGYVDDLRIFDKSLTQTERNFIYNDGNGTEDLITNGISILFKGSYADVDALELAHGTTQNGWSYYNTTDKKSYVYYDTWYQMTVDGVDGQDGQDGLPIVWCGEAESPNEAWEIENYCYRDTTDNKVYIYNGTAWELMVLDGSDGADGTTGSDGNDGLSVFITYCDNAIDDEPDVPTGDGTTSPWHTAATSAANWMSQKVAADATSGTWGSPIQIKGADGIIYYIKPSSGTAIHNSTGSLTISAHKVEGGTDTLLSSGTIKLYDEENHEVTVANGYATGSDGYTGVLDPEDISGDIVISMKDGPDGTVLDTITLVDVTDGYSMEVQYSADGTNWHETFADGTDIYMRTRIEGGTWSDAIKIVGEDGEKGDQGDSGLDNVDFPVTTGITWTNNTTDKKVSWSTGTLRYKGIDYTIAAEATGDTNKYIYWDLDSLNTTFKTTNTVADAIGIDKWLMCYNEDGTAVLPAGNKIIHGGLIQAGTLIVKTAMIEDLAVGTIKIANNATKLYAGGTREGEYGPSQSGQTVTICSAGPIASEGGPIVIEGGFTVTDGGYGTIGVGGSTSYDILTPIGVGSYTFKILRTPGAGNRSYSLIGNLPYGQLTFWKVTNSYIFITEDKGK